MEPSVIKGPFISTDIELARHVSWQTKQYSLIQRRCAYLYLSLHGRADINRNGPLFAERIFCLYVSVATCRPVWTEHRNRADVFYLFCLPVGIALWKLFINCLLERPRRWQRCLSMSDTARSDVNKRCLPRNVSDTLNACRYKRTLNHLYIYNSLKIKTKMDYRILSTIKKTSVLLRLVYFKLLIINLTVILYFINILRNPRYCSFVSAVVSRSLSTIFTIG